jgi:hypothetical protein
LAGRAVNARVRTEKANLAEHEGDAGSFSPVVGAWAMALLSSPTPLACACNEIVTSGSSPHTQILRLLRHWLPRNRINELDSLTDKDLEIHPIQSGRKNALVLLSQI